MYSKLDWESLKREYGIKISHMRNKDGTPKGTFIFSEDSDYVCWGLSLVNHKDQPVLEKGRRIAFGRYFKALQTGDASLSNTGECVGGIDKEREFKYILNRIKVRTGHVPYDERN